MSVAGSSHISAAISYCTVTNTSRVLLTFRLDRAQTQLDELYAKQGRISRFTTAAQRDAYLQQEIAAIDAYEASQAQQTAAVRVEYDGTVARIEEYAQKARDIDRTLEERKDTLQALAEEVAALKESHGTLTENRKCVSYPEL